jgi:hypothetical protein
VYKYISAIDGNSISTSEMRLMEEFKHDKKSQRRRRIKKVFLYTKEFSFQIW